MQTNLLINTGLFALGIALLVAAHRRAREAGIYYEVKCRPGPRPTDNLLDAWLWLPKVAWEHRACPPITEDQGTPPLSQSPPTPGSVPRVNEHWKHDRR